MITYLPYKKEQPKNSTNTIKKYGRYLIMKSKEYQTYLKKEKQKKYLVTITQLLILITIITLWQYLANKNIINVFITSSPKNILKTIINLYNQHNLWPHIEITLYETIISFTLGTIIGILIAIILWYHPFIEKVIDPYLTMINSLPKVSLGPIFIIWVGANTKSIIVMALTISLIITIITVYNGFITTDKNKIKLLNSLKATKIQMLKYLILPANYKTIISSLKINISMSLIGVIMGELLVSKKGIGYLIMYGSQVFNLDLVITGIIILIIVSYILYLLITYLEKILIKH